MSMSMPMQNSLDMTLRDSKLRNDERATNDGDRRRQAISCRSSLQTYHTSRLCVLAPLSTQETTTFECVVWANSQVIGTSESLTAKDGGIIRRYSLIPCGFLFWTECDFDNTSSLLLSTYKELARGYESRWTSHCCEGWVL
mmetsp:Transcript_6473/g.14714  ORF Transcript_6473/g.14714 Transcript_6473/m.14714 type:complete len:141 (-) Transcript_6473:234-656(-)